MDAVTGILVLAQAGEAAAAWPAVTAIGSLLINTGFAAFVGWYLLTKALPQMNRDFATTLKDQQTTYTEASKAQQMSFDARDATRRLDSREHMTLVLEHCKSESKGRDDMIRGELAVLAKGLADVRETMEELREKMYQK